MLSGHSATAEDPLLRPSFSIGNKLRRLVWNIVWAVFFRPTPAPLHHWRCLLLRVFGARIGATNFIYPSARIWAPWLLETGDVVTIGSGVEVYNPAGAKLEHHAIVSQGAYLCGATHDYNSPDFTYLMKEIRLEPYVWICARAIVLPGVTCRTGSVLGAGAVSSKDLEPWGVYAGNPARRVSSRSPEAALIK